MGEGKGLRQLTQAARPKILLVAVVLAAGGEA